MGWSRNHMPRLLRMRRKRWWKDSRRRSASGFGRRGSGMCQRRLRYSLPTEEIWEDEDSGAADGDDPSSTVVGPSVSAPVSAPEVITTVEDAVRVLAERGAKVVEATTPPRSPSANPRSARTRKKEVEKGDGRCKAYAPKGTKCKLCGKVHP